ncbi:MAG TPA: hypothetical protein VF042_09740, partial [Gemmatimonadaceae bacterium]
MRNATKAILFFSAFSALPAVTQAQIPMSEYAARRAALAQRVQNGLVVALGSPEPEEDFLTFNQNSNFKYLT